MPRGKRARSSEAGERAGSVRTLLSRHGVRPSRGRGQSFLIQPGIAERIARLAEIAPGDSVIEVGPGVGILTRALAPLCRRLACIEVDPKLVHILREEGGLPPHVEVIEADALEVDYAALARRLGGDAIVVANLPYAISTPILFRLMETLPSLPRWVLMLQREVGVRILARPGSKAYGTLSVPLGLFLEVRRLFTVGAVNFYPRPKVESVVLRFDRRGQPLVPVKNRTVLRRLVQEAFGRRRKTLANALAALTAETGSHPFQEAGIDPRRRGETLAPEEFARLANAFARAVETVRPA
jgi:16S rRNA (adenine1518-N6/adenine1519-N6)-dimethyltransferase